MQRNKLLLTVSMVSSIATAPVAAAQTQSGLALEEVIVTAQKREQSLQDVPISMVAYDRNALENRGIDELTDIQASVPNLVVNPFNNDPGAVRLIIRGIGQNDVQLTQDPSVALYLDGVYIGSSFGSGFEGVDIEQIEVLRGPQGTLYGRNATGGTLNITTKRANVEALEFRQDLTTGNLGAFKSSTMINIPLSETVALKANYLMSERDGVVENKGPGADFGQEDRDSLVVDLRWLPSEAVTVDYRYEQAEIADTQRFEQITALDPTGAIAIPTTINQWDKDRLDTVTSLREIQVNDLEIDAHTLTVGWDLSPGLTLKSITAHREFENRSFSDPLSTSVGNGTFGGFYLGIPNSGNYATNFEQFSQEFQLLGNSDRWEYVTGLYYYEDEGDSDAAGSMSLGNLRPTDVTATENTSLALFGEATYTPKTLDQRLHITVGARYSKDNRKANRTNFNIDPAIIDGSYDEDFSNFNPAVTVSFDLNDDMNVYGKVVSGFKSGGTSQRSANAELFARGFEEEEIISYELGYKGSFWHQRVRLNAALFSMDIDGLQTSVQTGTTPGARDFLPIDDNSIDGLEIDLSLMLIEGLTLDLSYGYLDTDLGAVVVDSPAGSFGLINSMVFAPETSYTVGLDYQQPVSNGELGFNLNYGYQDSFEGSLNADDNYTHGSYGLLGTAVSWSNLKVGSIPGHLKLLLWGKNLTDEKYTVSGGAAWSAFGAGEVLTFGDPRSYGLTVSYSFD